MSPHVQPVAPADQNVDPEPKTGLIEEAGLESFPASDPPSWTTGRSATDKARDRTEASVSPGRTGVVGSLADAQKEGRHDRGF